MEQTIIDKIKSGIETALDIKELGQIVSKFWNNKEKQEYFIKAYKEVMILYKSKYGIDLIYFTNAPKEDKGDEDWNPYIERMKKKLEENKNPIDLLEKIKACWRVSEKDLDENLEFLTQKFLEKILQYGCMNGEEVIVQIYWEIRKIHCALWSLQKHIDNDERYSPQNNGNNLFEKDNKINEKCHEYAGRYEEELPPMGDDSISVSLKQLYVEPEYSLVYPYESKREGLVFSYLKEFLHSEEKKKKKILFVEGDAGIGKTSLVSKIAYHYEHPNEESELGNDFFVGIRVICIRLRDMLEKSQTLNIENPWEDIFQYLNIAKENQRNELKRWSVLILDGFDELCMVESIQSEKKLDYFINLSRNLQSGRIYWKVIVTSRPNYIGWENLKKDLKGCMEIIQLQHFSIKKRNEWVEKAKEVELLITEDVKQGIIDSNREELEAIIGVPWTLYLIIRKAIVITANSNLWEIYNSIFKGENVTRSFEEEAHPTRSLQNDLYRITEEIAFWMYQNQCFDISLDTIRSLIDRIYEEADQEEKLRFLIQLKDTYALHTYYRKTDQRGGIAFYHNYIQDFFLSEEVFFELDKVYRELKQLKKWSQKEKCLICCYNRIFLPSILNEKVVQFIRFRIRYEYENNLLSKWVETEKENHIFAQVFENMMIYGFMDLNRKKITQKIKLQAMQTIFCNCWNIYDYVYSLQKKENHIFSDIIERNGNELGDLRKVIVENILKNVNFQKIYLKHVNLGRADLHKAYLVNSNFSEAYLNGSDLSCAKLVGADLSNVYLNRTDLNNANLKGANLSRAKLNRVDLSKSILDNVNLESAYLSGADLSGAYLINANLNKAYLAGADLNGVDLTNASLKKANLNGADLTGASLSGAKLKHANLSRSNLNRTNLNGADLTGVYLSGAYLREINLEKVVLNKARLRRINLNKISLKESELIKADLGGTSLIEVDFTKANLRGANLTGAVLKDTKLNFADLTNVVLTNVTWRNCIMDGTKLDGVKLMQFDLDSVEIIEMLSKADIKNANWMGITEKQKEKLLHKNIFYMAIYSK